MRNIFANYLLLIHFSFIFYICLKACIKIKKKFIYKKKDYYLWGKSEWENFTTRYVGLFSFQWSISYVFIYLCVTFALKIQISLFFHSVKKTPRNRWDANWDHQHRTHESRASTTDQCWFFRRFRWHTNTYSFPSQKTTKTSKSHVKTERNSD